MEARFEAVPLWRGVARLDPVRDLFGGLADFGEWQAVSEITRLWDPAAPGPRGNLAALPRSEWVVGPGSTFIMAPFAFQRPGRFGDGSFGVLYAALEEATALAELAHSRARFLRAGHNAREVLDHQMLTLLATGTFEDLRADRESPGLHDPLDWGPGQAQGARIRAAGGNGITYASVRRPGGACVAGFRPGLFSHCEAAGTVQFFWDGMALHGPGGLKA